MLVSFALLAELSMCSYGLNCVSIRTYILPNTFTPVDEQVLNRIKYYLRS